MDTVRKRERALLAALKLPKQRRFEVEESLDELGRLAESAGAEVVGRMTQERSAPTPSSTSARARSTSSRPPRSARAPIS